MQEACDTDNHSSETRKELNAGETLSEGFSTGAAVQLGVRTLA